jgi:hypothetical protein
MGDEGRHAPRDEKGDPAAGAPVSRYHAQHPGAIYLAYTQSGKRRPKYAS